MADLPEHMMISKIIVDYDGPNRYGDFYTSKFIWNPYSTYFLVHRAHRASCRGDRSDQAVSQSRAHADSARVRCVDSDRRSGKRGTSNSSFSSIVRYVFCSGMINFLFSIPFLFLALALGWRVGERATVGRNTLWLGLILLAIYFSHIVTFALTMLFLGSQWLVFHRRNGFGRLVVASAPSLGFAVAYFLTQVSNEVVGFGVAYEPLTMRLELLLLPLGVFRERDVGGGGLVYQWEAITIWLGVLATFAIGAIRERKWRCCVCWHPLP